MTTIQAAIGLVLSCAAAVLAAFAAGICIAVALAVSDAGFVSPASSEDLRALAFGGVVAGLPTLIAAAPACFLLLFARGPVMRLLRGSALRYATFGAALGISALLVLCIAGLPAVDAMLGMVTALASGLVGSLTFWKYDRHLGGVR